MIIGDSRYFAVESLLTEAYARLGLRALGCFVIHVGGTRYGVYEPNATLLANSFDEVERRIGADILEKGATAYPFEPRCYRMLLDAYSALGRNALFQETAKKYLDLFPEDLEMRSRIERGRPSE